MNRATSAIVMLLIACVLALVVGAFLPLLPVKLSLAIVGLLLIGLGLLIAFLLPDSRRVPYRFIYGCFFLAIFTKFLWPNFAYIPVAALPTKNPQRLIWALVIAVWVHSLATNPELRARLSRRCAHAKLVWLIAFVLAWRALTIPFAASPLASIPPMMLEFFDYLPALLFVLTWVRDEGDAIRVGRWLALAALVIAGFTSLEVALKQNLFLKLTPYDPSNLEFLQASLESKMRGGQYRAQATFNHPLLLAQFMAVVLPVLLLLAAHDRAKWGRRLCVLVLLSLPFVLWASRTRTSIAVSLLVIAIAAFAAAIALVRPRSAPDSIRGSGNTGLLGGMYLMVVLATSAAAIAFIVQLAMGRTAEESVSTQARIEMLDRAIVGTAKSPLVGLGPGQGGVEAANVNSRGRASLDSYPLILVLDSGIPALAAFLTLLVAASLSALKLLSPVDLRARAIGSWALSVIAFALTAAVLGTPHNLPLLYMAVGMIVALEDRPPKVSAARSVQAPRAAQLAD